MLHLFVNGHLTVRQLPSEHRYTFERLLTAVTHFGNEFHKNGINHLMHSRHKTWKPLCYNLI